MPDIWGLAAILTKFLLFVGVLGATGLVMIRVAFADLIAPLGDTIRRHSLILSLVALLASGLSFALRGAALTGGLDGMIDPEMLGLLWQTPVGTVLIYRLLGSALLIFGLFIPRVGQWIALIGGLLCLWSFTQIGHVSDVAQTSMRFLLLLHLIGIAFWVGVLGPLYGLSCQEKHLSQATKLGHQFGRVAMFIVPMLTLAGLVLGWKLLGSLIALITTAYGLTLLSKIALVAVVFVLAAANKFRFVPAMQKGEAKASHQLARSVQIETLIILGVLLATATLTSVMALPN